MADIVSPEKRSRMMAGIKGKDTKPELFIRKLLYAAGYRYRLNVKQLTGKPDIVLKKQKTAIFVHGCFWHGHEDCHLFRLPKSRTDFWEEKIRKNKARDETNIRKLNKENWRTMIVWECAIKGRRRVRADTLLTNFEKFLKNTSVSNTEITGT